MADKEVTVFVIDVSQTMGCPRSDFQGTALEWCLQYVWDKIGLKIMSGRKTDYVAVVAVGSDLTDHPLGDEEAYEHIRVIQPLPNRKKDDLRGYTFSKSMADVILSELHTSSTTEGDLLSAVVIGIHMITEFCQELKFKKNLILITNGELNSDFTDAGAIVAQIKSQAITFSVLWVSRVFRSDLRVADGHSGVDFDEPSYGYKEEDKSELKRKNEKNLLKMCEDSEGIYATFLEVAESLQTPRLRAVRPVATFKGVLSIGNIELYSNAVQIDVERYPKTKQAKAATATKFSTASETQSIFMQTQQGSSQKGGESSVLETTHQVVPFRAYKLQDGQELADRALLEKGYSYGKTIVPISKADEDFLQFKTQVGLQILGFLDMQTYARYMATGESSLIVAQKANPEASLALSSLIHALYESQFYALARLVKKDNVAPVMVMLAPNIEPDFESLLEVALPFAEDVRNFKFAPLDRVRNSKGEALKKHRYLPSDKLTEAMSTFMDDMNLDTMRDADGILTDGLPPEDTYNYAIHRVNQAILFRAFHQSSEPIPPPMKSILRVSKVPEEVVNKTTFKESVANLIQIADVKKVPPRTAFKRKRGHAPEPVKTGLDLDDLLGSEEADVEPNESVPDRSRIPDSHSIGHAHPLEDFEAMMKKDELIDLAFSQIQPVIVELVQYSLGEQTFGLAIQCLKAFRLHAIKEEEREVFNEFMQSLKSKARESEREDFITYLSRSGVVEISEVEVKAG